MKSNEPYEVKNITRETTVLTEMLGDTPINKLLTYLSCSTSFDYSITDLAKYSGTAYVTTKKLVPFLLENGFIKQTRVVGKAKMFTANMDNPRLKAFEKFVDKLASIAMDEYVKENAKEIIVKSK